MKESTALIELKTFAFIETLSSLRTGLADDGDGSGRREGKRGGKPSKPSKFVPGKIQHSGFVSDDQGRIVPMWFNELDPNARDPNLMTYRPTR